MISKKREIITLLAIVVLFIGLRIPGLDASYHQDEFKWVYYTYQPNSPTGTIPHPPLAEFLYLKAGPIAGIDGFRSIPFILGIIDLFLIFYFVRTFFGVRPALWTAFLYAVAFYSILSSLMVDVDGQFMPLFLLLLMISYYKLKAKNFELKGNWLWIVTLIVSAIGGSLIKLSGVLPVGAIALDFAIEKGAFQNIKRIIKYALLGLVSLLALGLAIYFSKYLFTYFDINKFSIYWKHFGNSSTFLDRGWLQTFIQFAKSILYTSPLLLTPVLFIDKEMWKKTRPFFFFVFIGSIFYLFAFDFSLGALDRYFQFFVVPLCIVVALVFSRYLVWSKDEESNRKTKNQIIFSIFATILIFSLQFLPHFIPSLHPKILWLSRILSLEWNFLFPFTGGSGPLPFYVSFLYISVIWVICLTLYFCSLKRPLIKKVVLVSILIFGLSYNAIFLEEYLFGKINGSAEALIKGSIAKIVGDKSIKKVLVYNDNGAFQVQRTGKYFRRIYAVPAYEGTYKEIFAKYDGHILYIDIPRIADDSMYKKYFNSCQIVFTESNIQISSKIYDCSKNITKTDI